MFAFTLLLLATAMVSGRPNQPRIIGGHEAAPGQFPCLVSIRLAMLDFHICGGFLVSPSVVMTAAHCLTEESPQDLVVVAGSNTLSVGGTVANTKNLTIHEKYEQISSFNDIGLILLQHPLELSDTIQTCLVGGADHDPQPGEEATATGWGDVTYPNEDIPDKLQYLGTPIVSNKDCEKALGVSLLDGQICCGGTKGQGLCFGDSGSPLLYKDYAIGIVSWGRPCAIGKPDVFTRPSSYMDWVNTKMAAWREEEEETLQLSSHNQTTRQQPHGMTISR